MNPLIFTLINHGNKLASLHDEARSRLFRENIYERVNKVVDDLLEGLESPQLPPSFPESIIPKVIEKIQDTVLSFKKLDSHNDQKYEDIAKKISDWKIKKQSSSSAAPSVPDEQLISKSPTGDSTQEEEDYTVDCHQFEQLNMEEMKCLSCWGLFSAGVELKKRELINWWVGMDLIADPIEGDEMLAALVEKELIERTIIGNKKRCNSYKMNENVFSKIVEKIISFGGEFETDQPCWSVLSLRQLEQQQQPGKLQRMLSTLPKQNMPLTTMVLNARDRSLSAETFEWLTKKKNVKVLHLGSWDDNPKRYIVVEDIETFKGLRNMGDLTCLSLQGISGIVELPDSVYRLDNLKILDLRACPNLESLSEGIESLKQLMHLDLSECYLLDHIPRGIALLTRLKVLKGFVINPEEQQVGDNNGNGKTNKKKNAPSIALFSDLSNLKELIKLTIRTRRMSFPTIQDFGTLSAMEQLKVLGILWVRSSADVPCATASTRFPKSVKKLELQAAPENTLSCLLRLISGDKENSLEKLYIRGGGGSYLGTELHYFHKVHTVHLRYLPELSIYWDEFRKFFPKLTRLEVSRCPNLVSFPCDENGVWVGKRQT